MIKNSDKTTFIQAKGLEISILPSKSQTDFISLTDIAKYRSNDPSSVIQN
ncbi:hypothetical protein [Anaerorhabdus sp.]